MAKDKVAQIGTFGTMMARAAVRDVARALGHPYGVGDSIAKLIPFGKQGFPRHARQCASGYARTSRGVQKGRGRARGPRPREED
jgi:DNA polymerase III alpha subunit